MTRTFGLTFDYLCPFARIVHDNVVAALRGGADWDVTFRPYSLAQGHIEEGDPDVWDREDPMAASGVLALCAGLAVRDTQPDRFLDVHEALFDARHDDGADIKERVVVEAALARGGADVAAVFDEIASGRPLTTLAREHRADVDEHGVWGVPTFITGTRAVFVRLLERAGGDADLARTRIEPIIDLIDGSPHLHEFKQTVLPF